jgi:ribosomal protein S27AE
MKLKIAAPWDTHQVASLNEYQKDGTWRPYKCKRCEDSTLEAKTVGLVCGRCGLVRVTVWYWCLDYSWKQMDAAVERFQSGDHSDYEHTPYHYRKKDGTI